MSEVSIIEIKARCDDLLSAKHKLLQLRPRFEGLDHQIDTYFKVPNGRLKLRRGNVENNLIAYDRPNSRDPKHSKVGLYQPSPGEQLYIVLTQALDVLVEVVKEREIYFVDNVKIHLDRVRDLGTFVEIEAIDAEGSAPLTELEQQCRYFMEVLGVRHEDLVDRSYSDLLTTPGPISGGETRD